MTDTKKRDGSDSLHELVGYTEFERELGDLCKKYNASLYCDYLSEQDGFGEWEVKLRWQPNV